MESVFEGRLVFEYYDEEKQKIRRKACMDKDRRCLGPYEEYYENGQLKFRATYAKPYEVGSELRTFTSDYERFVGEYVSYFENGQVEEKKFFDENGQVHGHAERHWFINSQYSFGQTTGWRSEYANYNHGQLEGDYEMYLEREKYGSYIGKDRDSLYIKCTYKDGKRHGNYEGYLTPVNKEIFERGQPWTRCSYDNDALDGDFISFDLQGNVLERCTMSQGKIHGLYKAMNDNSYGYFENGIPVGEHFVTYLNGAPMRKINYNQNGVLDGEYIKYNAYTKSIQEKIFYKDGKKEGLYQCFLEGKLVEEGFYKDDKQDGIWKRYSVDGQLIKMEAYQGNILVADLTESALKRQAEEEKKKIDQEKNRFEQEVSRCIATHGLNIKIDTNRQNEG